MTPIVITTCPYASMRYPTLGDLFYEHGALRIVVATDDEHGLPIDEQEQFLIALHELVEVKLCEARGITQVDVDRFDLAYTGEGEPGDEPDSPYRREHRFAMMLEHLMAHELGMTGYGIVR
jgi:hypothetical protein